MQLAPRGHVALPSCALAPRAVAAPRRPSASAWRQGAACGVAAAVVQRYRGRCQRRAEGEQVVTPWEVEAGEDGDKLIETFGCQPITQEQIERIERLTGKRAHRFLRRGLKGEPFYIYTGRGPSSESLHLGHLVPFLFTKWLQEAFNVPLVIELTDDEKFLFKKDLSIEESRRLAWENAKAAGQKFTSELWMTSVDPLKLKRTAQNTFGFTLSDNIGKVAFAAVQASPAFAIAFPDFLEPGGQIRSMPQELEQIGKDYAAGKLLTGEVKKRPLWIAVVGWRMRARAEVDDELLMRFMDPSREAQRPVAFTAVMGILTCAKWASEKVAPVKPLPKACDISNVSRKRHEGAISYAFSPPSPAATPTAARVPSPAATPSDAERRVEYFETAQSAVKFSPDCTFHYEVMEHRHDARRFAKTLGRPGPAGTALQGRPRPRSTEPSSEVRSERSEVPEPRRRVKPSLPEAARGTVRCQEVTGLLGAAADWLAELQGQLTVKQTMSESEIMTDWIWLD
eukprot:Skav221047  [mRNA]  locus=scaffold1448:273288:295674:+ [translate_table: standard]